MSWDGLHRTLNICLSTAGRCVAAVQLYSLATLVTSIATQSLLTPCSTKMMTNYSPLLIPALLITGCVALGMNILNTRKVNKALVEKIERARSDMKVAMDTSQDCSKQLEMKSPDQTAHE